ncbi:MAG: hypothetical protein FJ088_07465 [Deltaproteobacteria bacterium]|nr:hypothetical protein [Deltaproteobacteria bacterium]
MSNPEKKFIYIAGFKPSLEASNAIMSLISEFLQSAKNLEGAAAWYSPVSYHCPLITITSRLPAGFFSFEKALSTIKPFEISLAEITGMKIEGVDAIASVLVDPEKKIDEVAGRLNEYLQEIDCENKTASEFILPVAVFRREPADFPAIRASQGKEVRFRVEDVRLFELADEKEKLKEVRRFLLK